MKYKEIRDVLIAESTLTDVVSTRVYSVGYPLPPTRPFIVTTIANTTPERGVNTSIGFVEHDIEIDIYADTVAELESLTTVIQAILDDDNGTYGATKVHEVSYEGKEDTKYINEAGNAFAYLRTLDFQVNANQ